LSYRASYLHKREGSSGRSTASSPRKPDNPAWPEDRPSARLSRRSFGCLTGSCRHRCPLLRACDPSVPLRLGTPLEDHDRQPYRWRSSWVHTFGGHPKVASLTFDSRWERISGWDLKKKSPLLSTRQSTWKIGPDPLRPALTWVK